MNFNGGCLESPEGAEAGGRENQRREKNERYFNETVTGSRCTFWTPDKKMEPENG